MTSVLRLAVAAFLATVTLATAQEGSSGLKVDEAEAQAAIRKQAQEEAAKLRPGIVGDDDRRILTEDDPALRAVGRLNRGGRGFCTATLIAPDRVATAAHCLYFSRTGKLMPPDRLHFLAGYRRGDYVAHRVAAAIDIAPGFTPPKPEDIAGVAADIAIITLAEPIPSDAVTPIPLSDRVVDGARLTIVSYGKDRPELPSIETDCAAIAAKDGVLFATCDVISGASGGPLMVRGEAADGAGGSARPWRIAAVVSGYAKLSGRTMTLGAVLDETIAE